jgi:hypothetical protein
MGPGPQASHQKGASHEKKISFTFKLCGGGKKSEGKKGEDNGEMDRRMKKCEVKEKKILDDLFLLIDLFQWAPGLPLSKSGAGAVNLSDLGRRTANRLAYFETLYLKNSMSGLHG